MPSTNTIPDNKYRTHSNGELRKEDIGSTVRLSGWVQTRRDHGGLIFVDLRDRWGITQITFNPEKNKDTWAAAEKLRSEYVISIEGNVVARPKEMVNKNIETGEIEIEVSSVEVLNTSKTLPFEIDSDTKVNEEIRLKYRFLDLRSKRLQEGMRKRHKFIRHIRQYMHDQGFVDVQTPILANESPEGARDFLVPSRLHPGKFYALPQAPQQFKQLLMVAGLERYFQIAPCFRDEDPRADRHPGTFYQIDMEMSFVEQEDIFNVIEPLMIELTEEESDKEVITKPFPRIPWREVMTKYGTDKPDLRFDLFISDVTEQVQGSDFNVFASAIEDGGVVHGLHVADGAKFSRKDIDELTDEAKRHGAQGLAYITVKDKIESPILKHLGEDKAAAVVAVLKAKKGNIIFFGAGKWLEVSKALGAVRSKAAKKLNLLDSKKAAWCWITDFPHVRSRGWR